jgi:hypothetical protein
MALKAVLENLEGVSDSIKSEYKQGEDKRYYLDLDGVDEHIAVGALKRAKEHEVKARKVEETRARELAKQLEVMEAERNDILKGAIPKGDVDRLEKSYQAKLAAREKELGSERDSLASNLRSLLVDSVAQGLAAKLAKTPNEIPLLLPHITGRLATEMVDGKATTRILDKDGKPSALTLDDLRKEFVANPTFAAVIMGSKATGSGAGGSPSGGSASAANGKSFASLTVKEQVALIKAKREAT